MLADNTQIQKAVSAILADECIVFPTETVYGLGANALSEQAVHKIFHFKNRPPKNPLIVHIADINQITDFAHPLSELEHQLFTKFSPGPFSLILHKKSCIPDIVTGGFDTVGIRIPDYPLALEFLKAVNLPICAPSANISGKPSPTTFEMAQYYMNNKASVILDGGNLPIGIESTVVKVSDNQIYILRAGFVTAEMITEHTGIRPILDPAIFHQESPGTRYAHYQPKASVILIETIPDIIADNSMLLSLNKGWIHKKFKSTIYFSNIKEYAQQLYVTFFEADKSNIDHIYCEIPPQIKEGSALFDRLFRASQKS